MTPRTIVMACLFTRASGSSPSWRSVWLVAEYSNNRPLPDRASVRTRRNQSTWRIGRRSCAKVRPATRSISAVRHVTDRVRVLPDLVLVEAVDHGSGDGRRGLAPETALLHHGHHDVLGVIRIGANPRGEPRGVVIGGAPRRRPSLARHRDRRGREAAEGTLRGS